MVLPLLTALNPDQADAALQCLPAAMRERLDAMSPASYQPEIRAPQIVLLHDRDDVLIPVGESRRLRYALAPTGRVRWAPGPAGDGPAVAGRAGI